MPTKYPPGYGSHWNTCWRTRSHHGCCVALVERMATILRQITNNYDLTDKERAEAERLLARAEEGQSG